MEQKNSVNRNVILGIFLFGILLISSINSVSAASDFVNLDEYDIEYAYNDAVAGDRFTLTVTITNQDSEDKDGISFEFNEDNPFEFVGDDDWDIESLTKGESVSKNFRIEIDEDAYSDNYELEFKLKDSEKKYDDVFIIEVNSNLVELAVGDITSDPKTILPDMKDIKLTVEIENSGDYDAKFVKAKLKLPQGFTPSSSYSDIDNMGTIKAGETKTAVFYVDTEKTLSSNLYSGSIELNYKNDNKQYLEELEINLPVQGIPQFSISSATTTPSKVTQGDSVVIRVNIENYGEKDGIDTSIKVFEKSDQPFEFNEKTYFIGTIKPSSIGNAVFKVNIDSDATPTNYLLGVQIRTVYNGEVLVSEETIPINIYEKESGITNFITGAVIGTEGNEVIFLGLFIFLVLVLLVLVLIIVFRKFKKR